MITKNGHFNRRRRKEIPISIPAVPTYGGRREFFADPDTDRERFMIAVGEAHEFAARYGWDTAVFKNQYGFYLIREVTLCEPSIMALYVALVRMQGRKHRPPERHFRHR